MQIRTRQEMWDFEITHAPEFGAETLHVRVRTTSPQDFVEVRVTPPDDIEDSHWDALWELVTSRVIDTPALGTKIPSEDKIETCHGIVLRSAEYKGKLFSRGLFVCDLPDRDYRFGYDLPVELDRDRRMADPWSLRYAVVNTLNSAVSTSKLASEEVLDLVLDQSAEMRAFAELPSCAPEIAQVCAAHFKQVHGENAIPVSGYGEGEEYAHVNLKPVVVDRGLRTLLERALGTNQERLETRKNEVKRTLQAHELGEEAWTNLKWACALMQRAVDSEYSDCPIRILDVIAVVEFHDDKILGMYGSESIKLSHQILDTSDRHKLIATLAHEVGHHYESRGGNHATITENLLGRVIALAI